MIQLMFIVLAALRVGLAVSIHGNIIACVYLFIRKISLFEKKLFPSPDIL